MSQSTESATSRTPAASARQTASIPLSEETFRRWLAVLIAAVTLLVAIAAFCKRARRTMPAVLGAPRSATR